MVTRMEIQANAEGVAAEVRAELARQKISGRELARRIDRNQVWVARRLNGEVPITADELREFAFILGKPIAQFYGEAAA